MTVIQPSPLLVQLGRADKDPNSATVRAKVTEWSVSGSAIYVASKPVPGAQLMFDTPAGLPHRLTEGAFIRAGGNFRKLYIRHESNDGGSLLLSVYPPTDEKDYPSLLQTQPMERARGIVNLLLTEAAASIWRARLQNAEPFGGRVAYIHSLDLEHSLGPATAIRVRIDMNQDISSGAAGEAAFGINWNGSISGVPDPGHFPVVRMMSKGAAWADPPAAPASSYYMTLSPDNGLAFEPPFPLMPQKELRIAHLASPGLTGSATADVSGDVIPSKN
jgi:hypothetical protein